VSVLRIRRIALLTGASTAALSSLVRVDGRGPGPITGVWLDEAAELEAATLERHANGKGILS
jgi:hypothetical protein